MAFHSDQRGQSVVVGTVILFGFLILALSLYQVQVVPMENTEVEFEHSQQTEREFLELRNNVINTGTTGAARSTAIELGTRYPQRTVAINPPAPSGRIETSAERPIEINATVDSDAVSDRNIELFWDSEPQFETRSIQYTPQYNEFRDPPQITYEHSYVSAEFDSATLLRADQTLVRDQRASMDSRITLPVLMGTVSETGVQSESIDSEVISQQARTIPITGDGDAVEIRLPTAVGDAEALASRLDIPAAQNVTASSEEDVIVIELAAETVYQLGLAAVSVDGSGQSEPQYLVPAGDLAGERNVTQGQRVGIEARDKYNNPVSGATVEIDETNRTTNDDGRVFVDAEGSSLTAQLPDSDQDSAPDQDPRKISFDIRTGNVSGADPVLGPDISVDPTDQDITATQGDVIELGDGGDMSVGGDVSSIGTDRLRSGTPIQAIEYTREKPNGTTTDTAYATFDPDASNRAFAFDEIDTNGVIDETPINTSEWGVGEHTLRFSAQDASGRVTSDDERAEVTVTIEREQDELEFEIDEQSQSVTIVDGETVDYTATAIFSDGNEVDVTDDVSVESDDSTVVSVDESANTVTGIGPGEAVTVTAIDGAFEDTVDVTVEEDQPTDITNAQISDVGANVDADDDEVQDVRFELQGSGLDDGETVTVDLDEAQTRPGQQSGNVDYDEATANIVSGDGTVEIDIQRGQGEADLVYTSNDDPTGEIIIEIVGYETDGEDGPYTIPFTRDDTGDEDTDMFSVVETAPTFVGTGREVETIQAGVDRAGEGGDVRVDAGVYDESVLVSEPDISIRGHDETTVIPSGSEAGYTIRADDVTLTSIQIADAGNGIVTNGERDELTVRDTTITDSTRALVLNDDVEDATLDTITIQDITGDGGVFNGETDVVSINNTEIINIGGNGLQFNDETDEISITNAELRDVGGTGLQFNDETEEASISNAEFRDVGGTGLQFDGETEEASISNAVISNTGGDGLLFNSELDATTVEDTTVSEAGGNGAVFNSEVTDTIFSANVFETASDNGLLFNGETTDTLFTSNTFRENGAFGLQFNSECEIGGSDNTFTNNGSGSFAPDQCDPNGTP